MGFLSNNISNFPQKAPSYLSKGQGYLTMAVRRLFPNHKIEQSILFVFSIDNKRL